MGEIRNRETARAQAAARMDVDAFSREPTAAFAAT
jgi:hypothetical protein